MFTRPSMVNTQIKKNKLGRRSLMKTLGIFELHTLVDRTYSEFKAGKSIDKIFQENAIAKKHKQDYEILLINKFLKEFDGIFDIFNVSKIKELTRFSSVLKITDLDLGFVYCIKINNKIKIGKTKDFLKRMASYTSHNGMQPTTLQLRFTLNHSNFEKQIITQLENSGTTNEWFDESLQDQILKLF